VSDEAFPADFFERADPSADRDFYDSPRFVTHIDQRAVSAVGALYEELQISGDVLDLMSSWVSHFLEAPNLTVLGMNEEELLANPQARAKIVQDLNLDPKLPFEAESFDAAVCCVSVDYLTRPVEVFAEVARVLRPGGMFVCTFSNRCFPTKAIRGWLRSGDAEHRAIVESYFRLAGAWDEPVSDTRSSPSSGSDPLYAVWARRTH
jgi:SAM-dependent methyltransferase